MNKPRYTPKTILKAINGSGGIVSTIAKKLGCSWSTAQKYVTLWEETRKAYKDEGELVLDLAEGTLITAIQGGDVQSAKWMLSTKGKMRGYNEKIEMEHSGGIDVVSLTPEERDVRIAVLLSYKD